MPVWGQVASAPAGLRRGERAASHCDFCFLLPPCLRRKRGKKERKVFPQGDHWQLLPAPSISLQQLQQGSSFPSIDRQQEGTFSPKGVFYSRQFTYAPMHYCISPKICFFFYFFFSPENSICILLFCHSIAIQELLLNTAFKQILEEKTWLFHCE